MSVKRTIDVREQKRMHLNKTFRFCLKGIHHRLFRSGLTLAVVVLAVAFFMTLLTESVLQEAVAAGVARESAAMREPAVLLNHLLAAPSSVDHSRSLAALAPGSDGLQEYARVTPLAPQAVNDLAARCSLAQRCLAFFDAMSIGKRRILIKKHAGQEIFQYLRQPDAWKSFLTSLEPMRSLKLPTDEAALRTFLDGYEAHVEELERLTRLWGEKIAALAAETGTLTGDADIARWLVTAEPARREQWRAAVVARGFRLEAGTLDRVRRLLELTMTRSDIERKLRTKEKHEAWRNAFQASATMEEKMRRLADRRVAAVLDNAYTPDTLRAVVEHSAYEARIKELERWLAPKIEVRTGAILGGRQIFLALIAFLVCVVGITNAMLMSVTERFREIATMKCLGATDGFILQQFVLEAAIQGVAGGICGMLIGLLIAVVKNYLVLGNHVFLYFPSANVVVCSLSSCCAGVVLAMVAAIYPSWSASRMAPMEAMRVE